MYLELKKKVGYFLGYGRDSAEWSASQLFEVDDVIQTGVRQFYSPPVTAEGPAHLWAFLTPVADITIPAGSSVIDAPVDLVRILGTITFQEGDGLPPIVPVNESYMRQLQERVTNPGSPVNFAVRYKDSDGTGKQGQEIMFWPETDQEYTLSVKYQVNFVELSDSEPCPLGGNEYTQLVTESCLAEAEMFLYGQWRGHGEMFIKLLNMAVLQDRKRMALNYGQMNTNRDYSFDSDWQLQRRAIH